MRARLSGVMTRALLMLLVFAAPSLAAAGYRVESFAGAPPTELAAEVRGTLSETAIRVSGPEGPYCEIWLRKEIPAQAKPSQGLGISYGDFAEGTLFGAIRFLQDAKDYRKQSVKSGVYTLRFALIPTDGNHMGVSPNRDYFLLSPATGDTTAGLIPVNDLYGLSRKVSGTSHPATWSLKDPEGEAAQPEIKHHEEENHWVLAFRVSVKPEGGTVKQVAMALVVVGSAPEA